MDSVNLLKHLSHSEELGAARCARSCSLNYLSTRAIQWCCEETIEASDEAWAKSQCWDLNKNWNAAQVIILLLFLS